MGNNQDNSRGSRVPSLQREVAVPNAFWQSVQGRYFAGQGDLLLFGEGSNAWCGLFNPPGSDEDVYLDTFTITNYTQVPINCDFWLNTNPPDRGSLSNQVSPANTAFIPTPRPNARIRSEQEICDFPVGGVNVLSLVVPARSSLVSEQEGKFILPPGGNCVLFLHSPCDPYIARARVYFGWWESNCP